MMAYIKQTISQRQKVACFSPNKGDFFHRNFQYTYIDYP